MVTKEELKLIVAELNRKLSDELIDGSPEAVVIEEKPLANMLDQEVYYYLNGRVAVNQDALNELYPYIDQQSMGQCLYDHIRDELVRRGRIKGRKRR